MKRLLFTLTILLALLCPVGEVFAASSLNITITAIPTFISITNTPATWTINGITGNGFILPNTTYYSNPLGDTTAPAATVADGSCRFTVTNASSSIALDLTVTFGNFSSGDASTNSNTGSNGATTFGAYSWYSGMTYSSKVVAKTTGSSLLYDEWSGSTLKWGAEIKTQSNAWGSGTPMTATMTITATAD
jgi:hypothetical protein